MAAVRKAAGSAGVASTYRSISRVTSARTSSGKREHPGGGGVVEPFDEVADHHDGVVDLGCAVPADLGVADDDLAVGVECGRHAGGTERGNGRLEQPAERRFRDRGTAPTGRQIWKNCWCSSRYTTPPPTIRRKTGSPASRQASRSASSSRR